LEGVVKRSRKMVIVYVLAIVAFLVGYGGASWLITRLFHPSNADVRGVIASAIAGALVGSVLVVGRRWAGSGDPGVTRNPT
jgi:hypothetical protein